LSESVRVTGHSTGAGGGQWLLILAATVFNLLFEYSGRGIGSIIQAPIILPALFFLYFTLFTILEDLIVEFRLRDYHFVLAAFFYGTIYQFLAGGALFYQPGFLEINWLTFFFVNLVMWASLQGIFTFYLANRVAPRAPRPRLLSNKGWAMALLLNFISLLLIRYQDNLPAPSRVQWIVLVIILVVSALLLNKAIGKREWRAAFNPFHKSTILDLIGIITIVIFAFNALYLAHGPLKTYMAFANATTWNIDIVWATAVAIILLVYRLLKGESIPV
jgi:hypothetical protein